MSFRVEEKCILKNIDKNKFKSTLFKIGGKILFPKREIILTQKLQKCFLTLKKALRQGKKLE